jgi:4-amino-4-deoxy-L-arabinose transferase-like glycosyltransferase
MSGSAKINNLIQACTIQRIIFLALGIRLIWYALVFWSGSDGFWLYDSNGYWNIAYNLKEYGEYSLNPEPPLITDYFRPPLYPLFIYPTLWFDASGNSIPLLQIVLDLITCWLVYKSVLALTQRENFARIGGLLFALNFPAIVFCNYVLSETLFLLLITAFVYFTIHALEKFSLKYIFYCGIVGGLAVLCKPVAFYLFGVTVFFYLIKKFEWRKKIVGILCFTVVFYSVQFPWMYRNHQQTGNYFVSILGEHLINRYHAAHVESVAKKVSFAEVQEERTDRFMVAFGNNPYEKQYEYAKFIEKEAYATLWEYKWIFLKEHGLEIIKFYVQPMKMYTNTQIKNIPGSTFITYFFIVVQLLYSTLLYGIIAFVLYRLVRKRSTLKLVHWFMLTIVLLAPQFNTMPYTDARMRLPYEGLLIILALSTLHQVTKNNFDENKSTDLK